MPTTTTMMTSPTSSIDPVSIDACTGTNAAGLSPADTQKLMAGGAAGDLRLLYPYEGTVFPRGMLPPAVMWDGVMGGSAAYLHIQGMRFEYKGCLKPSAEGQLTLPDDVWKTAGEKTLGTTNPFVVELTVMSPSGVAGPVKSSWTVAQATIKGSIYYNSYSSMLGAGAPMLGGAPGGFPGGFPGPGIGGPGAGPGGSNGMVLRIPPGGKAEAFVSNTCEGCHSVSANGSRLLGVTPNSGGQSFILDQNTAANPPAMNAGPRAAFAALYPDGSVYLSTSLAVDIARSTYLSPGSDNNSLLYRTDDGMAVPNTGIPKGALMPMFSPDGSLLVFNDYAIAQAHGLAIMKYDPKTHTATDYRMLFKDTDMRPGWPFVLPDNGGVIFTRTNGTDFSGEGAGISAAQQLQTTAATTPPLSDIYMVDAKSGTNTLLAKAMGYQQADDASANKTYLPFGADDLHKSYFPTLSPVAAGGYFWLFFDAVRHYGNLGMQRQLWGAAIDIAADGNYSLDRSHPAFYIPGQEFGTGNHRAFAALDPCKKSGDSCTSGTDCCGGFCYVDEGVPEQEFVERKGSCDSHPPPKRTCGAMINERCTTTVDCCPPAPGQPPIYCIAGFCAVLQPPQ